MKGIFTKLMAALALLLFIAPLGMWGQTTTWTHAFSSPEAISNNAITVDGVTWNVSTTVGTGNPTITTGNSYSNYGLKFGSSASNYFGSVTFSTNYFDSYNVQSVAINIINNGKKDGTFTANQGNTNIGSITQEVPNNSWTTLTVNANTGSGGNLSFSYSTQQAFYIHSITVVYISGPTYTITAQSNNSEYGTVSLSGSTITATPNEGYRVSATTPYTVTSGTATVTQNGNTFSVAAESDCTVTINFEAIPTHVATFSVNGATTTQNVAEGAAITFPANPADIEGKTFMGWVENAIGGSTDVAPTFVTSATMGNGNVTYYAVFATADGSGPTTYEKLDSDSFDANAKYVIGAAQSSTDNTMWYYKGSIDNKWGRMTSNPETNAPVKFTLSGSASALVAKDDNGDYLKGLTSGSFEMSTSSTTIALTSSGTIRNSNSGSYYLRHNYNSGNGGLRWYSGNTGTLAYFYKVIPGVSYSAYCTTVAALTDPFITVAPASVEVPATAAEEIIEGTLAITYGNLEISDVSDFDVEFYDAQGNAIASGSKPTWIEVLVATEDPNVGEGYVVSYTVQNNIGAERMASFKVFALEEETNYLIYSNLVTISQAEYVAPSSWVLTDLADLTPADVFVIVGDNTETYALPSTGTGSSPTATEISVNTLTDPYTLENTPEASLQWNLIHAEDGYVFYPYGETTIWLNCTNSNDGVRVSNSSSKAKHFTLSDNGYLTTTETTKQRYLGIYNSRDWRTYENTTGNIANQSFSFYKKVTDPVTYTKDDIEAYVGERDNYYLIASPVASVTPSANNGFLTNDYDLYYFDDAQNEEWINHKPDAFNLVSGKGYLYANSGENVTLTFKGAPYFGNGLVPLQYTEGAEFAGWNLIGNPFNTNATLNMPYYRLNADGFSLITTTENKAVNVMEGVFVRATAANTEAVFTQVSSGAKSISQLNLKVTRNRGNVVDNAIIRFDEGATLGKFQLNENSTKVYFQQDGKDFAVVRSDSEAEMPVSFKAAENGTYTFSVNVENVEMNYLHLIDNLTGADVDLLATPSYSFEANTRDYANRFKLVFKANTGVEENTATETFAYFNGSEWVINNNGNATLQVVDMMGRVLSTETINGNAEVNLNQAAGVYMLRLVNKDNVKVQKVLVR